MLRAITRPIFRAGLKNIETYKTVSRAPYLGNLIKKMEKTPQPSLEGISAKRLEEHLKSKVQDIAPEIRRDVRELSIQAGDKHHNQLLMKELFERLKTCEVKVPTLVGLSEPQVLAFLKKKAPEVFSYWKKLQDMGLSARSFKEDPKIDELLGKIEKAVQKAFASEEIFTEEGLQEIEAWLEERRKDCHFLMVRSTGAEDSQDPRKAINAGGNISRAYVAPNKQALSRAMGDVIASYFRRESLQNRFNAGSSPFQEPLQLAVTVQELIGEPLGEGVSSQEIPVSFTLLTSEPLYVGGEKFRVMQVSATYGHGEGVVHSDEIATDTALVLVSEKEPDRLYYFYDNKKKEVRKAPVQEGDGVVLVQKPNPEDLMRQRAITEEQILSLYSSGFLVEAFFDSVPTDIEGIIQGGQIYFVQARGIKGKVTLPTYLSQRGKMTCQAERINTGVSSIVKISNIHEILQASTLKEAEKNFDADRHKLVIVNHPETSKNSHALINFKGLGVPCLYTHQDLSSFLHGLSEKCPLVVDMQTALLHRWDTDALALEKCIVPGFAVHPAKISQSIKVSKDLIFSSQKNPSEKIRDLLRSLALAPSQEERLFYWDALEKLPEIQELDAKIHAAEKNSRGLQGTWPYLEALKELDREIKEALEEAKIVLEKTGENERLQPLFWVKALESLLLGSELKEQGTIGAYCLQEADEILGSVFALTEYQRSLSFPSHCSDLLLYGKKGPPKAFECWRDFLLSLEPQIEEGKVGREELINLKELVRLLDETNCLGLWMMYFQDPVSGKPPADRLRDLLAQVSPSDQKNLKKLMGKFTDIQALQRSCFRFGQPEHFERQWKTLLGLMKDFRSHDLLNRLMESSPIVQLVGYQVMLSLVALFDEAVKTVKSSHGFQKSEHLVLFKQMVEEGFLLMTSWISSLIPGEWALQKGVQGASEIQMLYAILSDLPINDPLQLLPSKDFSVSAAMIGSSSAFERHLPERLEDVFTLVHQNCLAILSLCNQRNLKTLDPKKFLIPKDISSACQKTKKVFSGLWKILETGIKVGPEQMTFQYNIPLYAHSGSLDIHYDLSSQKMSLTGKLLGEARERWRLISSWIAMLEQLSMIKPVAPIAQTAQELSFSWKVNEENIDFILEEYKAILVLSLYAFDDLFVWDKFIKDRYEQWKNRKELLGVVFALAKVKHPSLFFLREEILKNPTQDLETFVQLLSFFLKQEVEEVPEEWKKKEALFAEWIEKEGSCHFIEKLMEREDLEAQKKALDLIEEAMKKTEMSPAALEAAKSVASKGLNVKDPDVQERALQLFEQLIEKGILDKTNGAYWRCRFRKMFKKYGREAF